jgi:Na+-transporting NADH:ubiquinone oxidoreductase subunit NqrB
MSSTFKPKSTPLPSTDYSPIPYRNVLFWGFLLMWIGPTSIFVCLVAATILYGPMATLPLWRQLARDTMQESSQLYELATHEPTSPEGTTPSSTLRLIATRIKNRFYDTM